MAQSQVLYQDLLGRMPVIFPRHSFTLLDSRAKKLTTRYELRVPDLFDHQENVEGRIAARFVPAGLNEESAPSRELSILSDGSVWNPSCPISIRLCAGRN